MGCGSKPLWAGKCTWFCCGNKWGPCKSAGNGACGTCQSNKLMGAWPYASDNCWDITRPDRCGEKLPKRGCGAEMKVKHNCSGKSVCITIADCGPRTKSFCDAKSCCGSTCRTNHIIDLTPAAFVKIGNLDSGHVPVLIYE
ncbi:MAG: hypothetical protein GEV07_01450 [Streptosporangiales bacterium]|nr:hypothetical protein [Streptosporangiales bacterium]